MHITKEGLVSKYIKIFYKSIKIKNIIRKNEPRRWKQLMTEEDSQCLVDKWKQYSISLVIREMQVKMTEYHFTPM